METKKNILKHSSFWSNLFKSTAQKSELENILTSLPLFKEFNSKDLKSLFPIIHNRVYQENEFIFFEGDPSIGMFIVIDGEISVQKNLENGNKLKLANFTKGDFFGEHALLNDEKRNASAIAVKDSNIAIIFKPDLDDYIEKNPRKGVSILRGLNEILAARLKNTNNDFINLYIKSIFNKEEII